MNVTEQIKKLYEQEHNYFLQYYNDRAEVKETEIESQTVKTSLFTRAILKYREENPDVKQFMIDNAGMDSIIPRGSIENGAANDGLYKQYVDVNKQDASTYFKDLTVHEQQDFRRDEKKLRDAELDINRKYAAIVGKRLTHKTIIDEILSMVEIAPIQKITRYYTLDRSYFDYSESAVNIIKVQKDFQKILEDNLNKQDNETLQTILNILRLIELPSKN